MATNQSSTGGTSGKVPKPKYQARTIRKKTTDATGGKSFKVPAASGAGKKKLGEEAKEKKDLLCSEDLIYTPCRLWVCDFPQEEAETLTLFTVQTILIIVELKV